MTYPPPWIERWLQSHGSLSAHDGGVRAARRAGRFPVPLDTAWRSLLQGLDVLGPALVLGQLRRASALDDASFHELERHLHGHPNPLIRLAYILARTPGVEQRYREVAPPDPGHPLHDLADTIALGQQHSNGTFDVVIVGSGAGGAPAAWALARRGLRVAIVESGSLLTSDVPDAVVEKHYLRQGMVGSLSGGGTTLVLAGNAVGGTTVINSGTSLPPRQACLEHWDHIAGTNFGDGGLQPWIDRVNTHHGIAPIPPERLDASSRLVWQGLDAIGRPGAFPLLRNAPTCEGRARCCFGCPGGNKLSTDRAYLPGAIQAGAVLFSESIAHRILPTKRDAEVWIRTRSGTRRLRARHVIVSGGALSTPGILRASRLGRTRLAGEALKIHPATKIFGMMPGALPHGGVPQGLGYRPPDLPRITFEGAHTPPSVTATILSAAGARHRSWMSRHDHLANYGLMVRDRSTGSVRRRGGQPLVTYRLHDDDALDLGRGLLIAADALFASGAEKVLLPVFGDDAQITPDQRARLRPEAFTRERLIVSGFHPHGTAGIGRVVDANLALYDTPRVHVCDASVLPDSPGVNPQVTIMALSLRLADHLAEHL